jgi:hypothetical protein
MRTTPVSAIALAWLGGCVFEWAMAIGYLTMLAALGVVGAVASMWSPNIRWRGR